MAEVDRLRREIAARDKEIRELRNQIGSVVADIQANANAEINRKLNEHRELVAKQMAETDEKRRQEYDSKLHQYEVELKREIDSTKQEMINQYIILQKSFVAMREEAEKKNKELESKISELRNMIADRDNTARKIADDCINEARDIYDEVSAMPHDIFFPGKINLFQINAADSMMEKRQYESASAIALSLKCGITLFQWDIEDAINCWKRHLDEVRIQYEELTRDMDQLRSEWIAKVNGNDDANFYDLYVWRIQQGKNVSEEDLTATINYWAKGLYRDDLDYLETLKWIDDLYIRGKSNISKIYAFLKSPNRKSSEELRALVEEIKNRRIILLNHIKRATNASDAFAQRMAWDYNLCIYFTDAGFDVCDHSYERIRQVEPFDMEYNTLIWGNSENVNYAGSYNISYVKSGRLVRIKMAPRDRQLQVTNDISIEVLDDEGYLLPGTVFSELISEIGENVRKACVGATALYIANDHGGVVSSHNDEVRRIANTENGGEERVKKVDKKGGEI